MNRFVKFESLCRKSIELLTMVAALLFSKPLLGQGLTPQSLNSAGQLTTQANGSLSYIVGELVVGTLTDPNGNSLGSGFNAGSASSTVSVQPITPNVPGAIVYPNPVAELLHIQLLQPVVDGFFITLTDVSGNELTKEKYTASISSIGLNLSTYSKGVYFLSIIAEGGKIKGYYKIIKD